MMIYTQYNCYCEQNDDQSYIINDSGTHCDQKCGQDDDQEFTIKHLKYDIFMMILKSQNHVCDIHYDWNYDQDNDLNYDDISIP